MYGGVFFVALLLTASLATALVYGVGGVFAVHGSLQVGHRGGPDRLPHPALRPADGAVQRAGRRHDRAGQLRPGLRGPRPRADDRRAARRRRPRRGARPASSSTTSTSATRRAEEVSLASLESVAVLEHAPRQPGALRRVVRGPSPGQLVALVGPSGAGKTTISHLVPRLYDVRAGAVRINGVDVRDATLDSLHDVIGVVTQDAHLFHETIRANLRLRPARTPPTRSCVEALRAAQILPAGRLAARRARHPGGRPRLPALGRREAAHRHRPAAAQGARHRRPRRGHRPPRLRVRGGRPAGADARALAGRTSIVIAHRLSTVRNADQILVVDDGRIVERGTHEQLLAAGGLYAELYRTQFEQQESAEGHAVPAPGT